MGNEEAILHRRVTLDDVSTLVDYRIRFLSELYDHQKSNELKVVIASIQEYLTKTIPSGDFVTWVAEHDGKIVATSGMVVWQRPAAYGGVESGRLGYLLNFYTIPEARRTGIATDCWAS